MANDYPLVGFHFEVSFLDLDEKDYDVKFQSVSGLNVQMETETLKEGGENRFEHVLPVRRKYSDLVLKRGVIEPGNSAVTEWCIEAFESQIVKPINILIMLLGENHDALVIWDVYHAWPKSWKYSDLNAEKGEILIETLELNYNRFEVF